MVTTTSPQALPASRPYAFFTTFIFIAFAATATWIMRKYTVIEGCPVNLEATMVTGLFADGTKLRRTYTGIKLIDSVLSVLVVVFLAGPAGWDEGIRLQQLYLLFFFFAIMAIWRIEACRKRNASKLFSYTTLFALFHQTLGGATIIPLYYAAYVHSTRPDSYLTSGREVSLGQARALLPSLLIGYLLPTVALYVPWGDVYTTQGLTALWQVCPVFPNILLLLLAPLFSSSSGTSKTGDVKYLNRIYLTVGILCFAVHLGTLYLCFTSTNPQLSFSYLFLPNKATWKQSTALTLHYIFQCQFWIIYSSSLVWCYVVIHDVWHVHKGEFSTLDKILTAVSLFLHSVALGPGTTMILVWYWRDEKMVRIEQGERGTYKKPKSA